MEAGWTLILTAGGAGLVLWACAHGKRAIDLFNDIAGLE